MMTLPITATYSGTKTSNAVFCKLMSEACGKSTTFKTLVDFQSVHPAVTTTAMNGYKTGIESSQPEQISFGSLCDLGDRKVTCGSIKHTI